MGLFNKLFTRLNHRKERLDIQTNYTQCQTYEVLTYCIVYFSNAVQEVLISQGAFFLLMLFESYVYCLGKRLSH